MTQPTPVTVHHDPLTGTRYEVRGLTFTRPKDAIRAADAFDRGITYVSPLREPLRSGSDLTGVRMGAALSAESDSERSGPTPLPSGPAWTDPPRQAGGASGHPAPGGAVQAGQSAER